MGFVRNEGEHVDRAEDAAVFLQSTMDQVLVVKRLSFAGEQDGCHRPIFMGKLTSFNGRRLTRTASDHWKC